MGGMIRDLALAACAAIGAGALGTAGLLAAIVWRAGPEFPPQREVQQEQ